MTGFQRVIYREPAPANAGDFASNNPRASVVPPTAAGFVVAAAQAVTCGFFAWGSSLAATIGQVFSTLAGAGANPVLGFVARTPNIPSVLITAFLAESKMTLNDGLPCTLQSSGDYYVDLVGGTVGAIVYADATSGAPTLTDNSGANPNTGWTLASTVPVNAVTAATSTIAASTGILTIATLNSGVVEVGQRVTGTGVPAFTFIEAQLTGAAGAAGTYQTSSRGRAAVAAFAATMVQGTKAIITKAGA